MEQHTDYRNFLFFDRDSYKRFSFTTRHEPTSSSSASSPPEFHINFELSCNLRHDYWVFIEHSQHLQLLRIAHLPMITTHIRLNLDQFLNQENTYRIIDDVFKWWPLLDNDRRLLTDFVLEKAHEVIKSMPASHNAVYLKIPVVPVVVFIFNETDAIRWATQWSMEEAGDCMVPAANSAIESLESRKILLIKDGFGTCSVCLDEFSRGCEAVCLPCSHVFHVDCIKEWLRTSHYCPLCRFEMPTA